MKFVIAAAMLAMVAVAPLSAQALPVQVIDGTRLDIVAEGRVTRVPDVARINAGVVTQAPSASAAISGNAERIARVVAALRRAGVEQRDIQTSQISLNPEYRYREGQSPLLTGYQASNSVSVRFRDVANAGRILDALVAQGANQINGPSLEIDRPEQALDEARIAAIRTARQRADLYAQATGKKVGRILSISEALSYPRPGAIVGTARIELQQADGASKIEPGEQDVSVQVQVSFELD